MIYSRFKRRITDENAVSCEQQEDIRTNGIKSGDIESRDQTDTIFGAIQLAPSHANDNRDNKKASVKSICIKCNKKTSNLSMI